MSGNTRYGVSNTTMLSIAGEVAPVVVTSDDIDQEMLTTLTRLRLRPGLLARVSGVRSRHWWTPDTTLAESAAMAGAKAISEAGVDPSDIGLLINTSVSREHLEPAVSVEVHDHLGLPSSAMNFDVTNACLGFVNGMQIASAMIDSGQIDYAVIVGSEDTRETTQATMARLAQPSVTREEYMNEFATLTLGSGSAAAVLGRASEHPEGHRMRGGVSRAATEHHGLCIGSVGQMVTNARGLLEAGVELMAQAYEEALPEFGWDEGIAKYVIHQVSTPHTRALVQRIGIDHLDASRVPLTFPTIGNVGPASLPLTLAMEADQLSPGDRVLCMGVGSGLNTTMCEIVW